MLSIIKEERVGLLIIFSMQITKWQLFKCNGWSYDSYSEFCSTELIRILIDKKRIYLYSCNNQYLFFYFDMLHVIDGERLIK